MKLKECVTYNVLSYISRPIKSVVPGYGNRINTKAPCGNRIGQRPRSRIRCALGVIVLSLAVHVSWPGPHRRCAALTGGAGTVPMEWNFRFGVGELG